VLLVQEGPGILWTPSPYSVLSIRNSRLYLTAQQSAT